MKTVNKLWILVMVLAIISPMGIVIPRYFRSGAAWGEWAAEEVRGLAGYVPAGMARLSSLWNAPLPDYGSGNTGYIFSAIVGIALVAGIMLIIGKFFKNE